MKKLLVFSFITALLACQNSFGQDKNSSVRLAFVLNPQLSWINSDDENLESGGSLFGYNFGVNMNKYFASNYAFHTGLTINTTGGVLKNNIPEEERQSPYDKDRITMKLKYLEIPFGLHLKTNEFRRTVYYGQFGLSGQLNIKAVDQDGNSLNSDINFFEMAYHFGGGIEYSIGGSNYLIFGFLFNNGITDITKNDEFKDKTNLNRMVFRFGLVF